MKNKDMKYVRAKTLTSNSHREDKKYEIKAKICTELADATVTITFTETSWQFQHAAGTYL